MDSVIWGTIKESKIFNIEKTLLICGECFNPVGGREIDRKVCFRCGNIINIQDVVLTSAELSPSGDFVLRKDNIEKFPVYGEKLTRKEIKIKYPDIYFETFEKVKMLAKE